MPPGATRLQMLKHQSIRIQKIKDIAHTRITTKSFMQDASLFDVCMCVCTYVCAWVCVCFGCGHGGRIFLLAKWIQGCLTV